MKTWYNDTTTNFQTFRKETVEEQPTASSNHTPGPWYKAERAQWHAEVRFIRTNEDKSGVIGLTNDRDAPLIAAAPELLSALESMVEVFERHIIGAPGPDDAAERWDRARDAIAKAKGV